MWRRFRVKHFTCTLCCSELVDFEICWQLAQFFNFKVGLWTSNVAFSPSQIGMLHFDCKHCWAYVLNTSHINENHPTKKCLQPLNYRFLWTNMGLEISLMNTFFLPIVITSRSLIATHEKAKGEIFCNASPSWKVIVLGQKQILYVLGDHVSMGLCFRTEKWNENLPSFLMRGLLVQTKHISNLEHFPIEQSALVRHIMGSNHNIGKA